MIMRTTLALLMSSLLAACAAGGGDADQVLLGRLFDAERGEVIEVGVVVIHEGRVSCSGAVEACRWPESAPLQDYGDALMLPGLIDLHVHVRPHYFEASLAAGITTLRDANNSLAVVRELRALPRGPRLFAAGPMLDGPKSRLRQMVETAAPLGSGELDTLVPIIIDSPESARATVAALAEAGVDWIKLYNRLDSEAFAAAVGAAHEQGLQVMADVGMAITGGLQGAEMDLLQVAEAGTDTIEHLSGLALAYVRRGGDVMALALDETLLDELADQVAASGMRIVPTIGNSLQFAEPGALAWQDLPGAKVLGPYMADHWRRLEGMAGQARPLAAADRRLALAMLSRLHAAGVMIGAGSDLPAGPFMLPGAALHQELVALVEAGLRPVEALQAATWNAGRILGADDLGHLRAGARADILIVEGDPTVDISQSRRVRDVWFDGERVELDAIWQRLDAAYAAALAAAGRGSGVTPG